MENQEMPGLISTLKSIPDLDISYAIEAMAGSLTLYERTLKHSVRLLPSHIGQMEQYLDDGDLTSFAKKIHGVKSSLRQIGCMKLSNVAESLERFAKNGDMRYCAERFKTFKKELSQFCDQVNEAASSIETNAGPPKMYEGDANDFCDAVMRAKEAVEDFDSITAFEILSPFMQYRFNESIDALLSEAIEELEAFQPLKALNCITNLLRECDALPSPLRKE